MDRKEQMYSWPGCTHRRERDNAMCELGVGADPVQAPVGLLLDAGERFDRVEELLALTSFLDVGVDQEAVRLAVNAVDRSAGRSSATCAAARCW
eukprot:SAG31_NODE_728_length_12522_cov_13.320534_7_plen_94_part_00